MRSEKLRVYINTPLTNPSFTIIYLNESKWRRKWMRRSRNFNSCWLRRKLTMLNMWEMCTCQVWVSVNRRKWKILRILWNTLCVSLSKQVPTHPHSSIMHQKITIHILIGDQLMREALGASRVGLVRTTKFIWIKVQDRGLNRALLVDQSKISMETFKLRREMQRRDHLCLVKQILVELKHQKHWEEVRI